MRKERGIPVSVRWAAASGFSAGVVSGVTAVLTLVHSAHTGTGIGRCIMLALVVGVFSLGPFTGAAFALRGRVWSRYLLAVLTVAYIFTTPIESFAATAATVLAAIATLLLFLPNFRRFSKSASIANRVGMLQGRVISATDAFIWLALLGFAGAHLFYVRRAWQGVLYCSLLGLTLLSIGSAFSLILALLLFVLVCHDATRLRVWVDRACGI
jgi:hypothetical protein